ncbi:MAG: trimethylamine methyltransferase family protein, partial [Chloroflexota bacterium]
NYETWVRNGSKTMVERASEQVSQIIAKHQPEPLPADIAKRLREVVQRAEAKAK